MYSRLVCSAIVLHLIVHPNIVNAQTPTDWYMAGANPQRTSWVPDEMPKEVYNIRWATPIEAHIPQKAQPIVADGKVYVPTSKGVVALNHQTGQEVWQFPTTLPIGNSPTIDVTHSTAYVPGLDHQLYAINTQNGSERWRFTAKAGFSANPLKVTDASTGNQPLIILGNRDGNMYAIWGQGSGNPGTLAWAHEIGSPITQSAAYNEGIVYVGGADGKAYAIYISDGSSAWISDQLPTASLDSWWPVIYRDNVVFSGNPPYGIRYTYSANNYPINPNVPHTELLRNIVWSSYDNTTGRYLTNYDSTTTTDSVGRLFDSTSPGYQNNLDWVAGTPYIDLSLADPDSTVGSNPVIGEIFSNPSFQHFRSSFILNQSTGFEKTFSVDDIEYYAPLLQSGDNSGSKMYPVVNGSDGVLYFHGTKAAKGSYFPQSGVMGWSENHPHLTSITHHRFTGESGGFPNDENLGLSSAGSQVFLSMINDRLVGSVDIGAPLADTGDLILTSSGDTNRQWRYGGTGNAWKIEGYDSEEEKYLLQLNNDNPSQITGGGLFYNHRESPGPAVYDDMIYLNRSNAIVALGPGAPTTSTPNDVVSPVAISALPGERSKEDIRQILRDEVQKIISAGHLGSVTMYLGIGDHNLLRHDSEGSRFYHSPFDTHVILGRALRHLNDTALEQSVINYLKEENTQYPIYNTTTVGYQDSNQRREYWPAAQEQENTNPDRQTYSFNSLFSKSCGTDPNVSERCYIGWFYAPHNLYTLYTYVRDVDQSLNPVTELNRALNLQVGDSLTVKGMFDPTLNPRYPNADKDYNHPHFYNAYIAGLIGYKGLLELGNQQGTQEWSEISTRLNDLMQERVNTFHWDITYGNNDNYNYYYYFNLASWNFRYMVPELAAYLKTNLNNTDPVNGMDAVINDYINRNPYWFVPLNTESQGEGTQATPHHYHDLFLAKAWLQDASFSELTQYIDAPGFKAGDMYYIDNLVAALDAPDDGTSPSPTPASTPGDTDGDDDVDFLDYLPVIASFLVTGPSSADFNLDNIVDIFDFNTLIMSFGR